MSLRANQADLEKLARLAGQRLSNSPSDVAAWEAAIKNRDSVRVVVLALDELVERRSHSREATTAAELWAAYYRKLEQGQEAPTLP